MAINKPPLPFPKKSLSSIKFSQFTKSQQAALVPALKKSSHQSRLTPQDSTPGRSSVSRESPNGQRKHESVASGVTRLISSSSLWVSSRAGGTGCRSCFPRWPLRKEQRRWEEAWGSLCQLQDHPERRGEKVETGKLYLKESFGKIPFY